MKSWIAFCVAMVLATELFADGPLPSTNVQYDHSVLQRLNAIEAQLQTIQRLPAHDQFAPTGCDTGIYAAACDPTCPACGQNSQACGCGGCGGKQAESKYPTFKITGFFQLDAGYYEQDTNNRATLGDIEDVAGFRRARLAAVGNVSDNTSYNMEFDFAQAQARFVDVWMQFSDTPLGNLRLGRFRQPFGMTELTSVKDLPFLERPSPFALSPFRQTGLMLFDSCLDERMTYAASGYRYLSDNFGNVYSDTGGYGMAARLTCLPFDQGDEHLVHLGVDYSFNDPGRGIVQFVSTNEFAGNQNTALGLGGLDALPIVAVPLFANTGEMPTNHTNVWNAEAAVSFGRLVFQSEARWAMVEQTNGANNTFPGAYVHVRYLLTGEIVPYNRATGVFGRVKPLVPVDICCGNWGAWEVAARWSHLDLDGTDLPGPGRRLNNTIVGLNWYLNGHTKFQFDWIHSDLNDATLGGSSAETLAVRGQIDF